MSVAFKVLKDSSQNLTLKKIMLSFALLLFSNSLLFGQELYSDSLAPSTYEDDNSTENSLGGTRYSEITKIINTERLNIREGVGTKYNVVGEAISGDVVRVIEEYKKWSLIETGNGIRGYVANKFLYDNLDNLPVNSQESNLATNSEAENVPYIGYIIIAVLGIIVIGGIMKLSGGGVKEENRETSLPKKEIREKQIKKQKLDNYGCSECGVFIKKDTRPSSWGCSSGKSHRWNKLGETGDDAYSCSSCGGVVYSSSRPSSWGCSSGNSHRWAKL
ncbi:SH3 domain-containing protein [Rufibacter tibetensis]|uniref:SH3b domain-containing protein n=1 Tax=Rufibacter tibetensis TaxID=512763 RepID=A0A0P0D1H3_9BACT|nr:SH3 domain-containing protein [Rufibacter tibetensis]ALJ00686.1 hypothetical protein DC20_19010 [Rufibacter tibetensis]